MRDDDFVLDEDLDRQPPKDLPPAIVSFEWIFFLVLIISQYLAFVQITYSQGWDGLLGVLWAGGVQVLLGIWQFISALVVWSMLKDKLRAIYLIISGISILILLLVTVSNGNFFGELSILFITIIPHGLAWFYLVICYRDSQKRKRALSNF
jgi:hypothetical protein